MTHFLSFRSLLKLDIFESLQIKNIVFSDCSDSIQFFLILSLRAFILFSFWILSVISSSLICLMKVSCCCHDRVFVRLSAIISLVAVHWNRTLFSECSWCSQWLWISTCLSFVESFMDSSVINHSVCVLSHSMIKSSFNCNVMAFRSLLMNIASLAVCDNARSLASVL